jgi:hypothetical protein
MEDITCRFLFTDPCDEVQQVTGKGVSPTSFWDIRSFIRGDDEYGPRTVILQFFRFLLRNHFKYRFTDDAFAEDPNPSAFNDLPFHSFAWPWLFSKGEWGDDLVEPIY